MRALKNFHWKEIDIPIKNLDDETMLKIMAQENMEEWSPSHIVAMEAVKAVYNYMKENKLFNEGTSPFAKQIAGFISWPVSRVEEALSNLRASNEIDMEGRGKAKEAPEILREVFEKPPSTAYFTDQYGIEDLPKGLMVRMPC